MVATLPTLPAAVDRAHGERVRAGRGLGAYGEAHAANGAPSSEHSNVVADSVLESVNGGRR